MPLKKYLDYDGLDYLIQRIPRTKIKVTFDEVFAGETATCSMGTTIYTKTVPATEPYELTFPINELGTWTIATSYLGDDYGTTIEVTAIGQTATGHVSYETTPEGATVTPTDDIQTWLACANITDKSYTTLAEVLADRETFETLIADSNACDYMARSTTLAVAEGAVPTLTTTSSNVISSGDYSSQPAWKVFDGDNSTPWSADATYLSGGAYVGYKFDTAKNINRLGYIKRYESVSATQVWKIQGSNDGTDWIDLSDNFTVLTASDNDKSWYYINFTNTNSYLYYRVYEISNNNNSLYPSFMELQFYEADITHSQDAMSLISKYDYCSNALLGNATWAEAIANSEYFESVLNVKVPTMTSNTTPSGECFGDSLYSDTYTYFKAFDKDNSTFWASSGEAFPHNLGYNFGNNIKVTAVDIYPNFVNGNARIKNFKIQGFNNNDWVDLYTGIVNNSDTTQRFSFVNENSYSKYRLYVIDSHDTALPNANIKELQFYGRASAQTNIIHSAANDTIYMMENGSQVVLTTTNSDGDGILDFTQFMDGTYTLYSSVAKDPTNLSNDYSKSIRITKTSYGCTTEAYLMPDTIKTLYWYGFDSGLIEDCVSANGWSWSGVGLGTPTHNTNDITLSSAMEGVKNIIDGTHNIVVEGVTIVAGTYGSIGVTPSKAVSGSDWTEISTSGKLLLSKAVSNKYCIIPAVNGRNMKLHAWWYE